MEDKTPTDDEQKTATKNTQGVSPDDPSGITADKAKADHKGAKTIQAQPYSLFERFMRATRRTWIGIKLWWRSLRNPAISNRLITVATIVIAGATVATFIDVHIGGADTHALAVAAGSQASAAKIIADVSRDSLESVQRAFLIFQQPLDALAAPDAGDPKRVESWGFTAKMENSGTTPTREAVHHVSWTHMPGPIPTGFDLVDQGDPTITPFFIGPKQVLSTGALQIPPEVLEAVRNHTDRIYLWGWATYRDVFKATPEHITMFCMELTGVRGADTRIIASNPIAFLFANCTGGGARHNCADKECNGEEYGTPRRRWPN